MVVVTLVLLLAFVVVVVIVVAGAVRRALVDERQSVRDYQHTIETLRHIGDRNASSRSENGSSSRAASNGATSRPAESGASALGTRQHRSTMLASSSGVRRRGARAARPPAAPDDTTLFFDDGGAATAATGVAAPGAAVREIASGRLAGSAAHERHAAPAESRGTGSVRPPVSGLRRRYLLAAGVVVLAGALAGVVLTTASSPPARTAAHAPVVKGAAGRNGGAGSSALQPVSSSSTAATYQVPAGPYTVVLSATAPCWVMATDASGNVLWTGTLVAGETRTVSASGKTLVRLGAASNVTMSAAGRPVQLPSAFRSPFDLTFSTA